MRNAALAAAVSGILYSFAQPSWGFWPLAGVCLFPLLYASRGRGRLERAALGWLAGTVATGLATVVPATIGSTAFFGLSLWQGALVAVTVGQVFGAGSFALAAVLAGDPSRQPPVTGILRFGCAWAGAEWVRSTLFTGLPWLLLAHSLAPVPALIQLAQLGGTLLVTAWIAVLNAALFHVFLGTRRAGLVALAATGFCVWLSASTMPRLAPDEPGGIALEEEEIESTRVGAAPGWVVLLVQGNIPNDWRGDIRRASQGLERLVELTRAAGDVQLAVWPENAVSFLLPVNASIVATATRSLGSSPDFLLLGSPRTGGPESADLYNSAMLFGPERELRGHHDKVHLLPFAEYTPWPFSLARDPVRDSRAGREPQLLHAGPLRIGPLICYEIVFGELARSLVRDGADLLINISNDAWFGSTGAIEQHFASAIFRAVENHRVVLRATNTGVTAAIDASGQTRARLALHRPGSLRIRVQPATRVTWYVRTGEIFGPAAFVVGLLALGAEIAHDRRRGSDGLHGASACQ